MGTQKGRDIDWNHSKPPEGIYTIRLEHGRITDIYKPYGGVPSARERADVLNQLTEAIGREWVDNLEAIATRLRARKSQDAG
jgi:hypothetical protein